MWVGVPHSPQLILNIMEQKIKELLNNIICHKISIGDGIEEIKKLFSEYTHPVMNYNKKIIIVKINEYLQEMLHRNLM